MVDKWQTEIDRYVDAELPDEQMRAMTDHLRECASCSAGVLHRIQLKRATRLAGNRYVARADFRKKIEQQIRPRTRFKTRWRWAPAFVLAAGLLVAAGLSLDRWSGRSQRQEMLTEIADLHVTNLASQNTVDVVSSDRHTVKPWFQGKLPFTFDLPELQGSEFKLIGGRMAYFEHEPGAHLIYDLRGHHISVFIFRNQPELDRAFSSHDRSDTRLSFRVESWMAGGLRFFAIGDAAPSSIRQLVELFQKSN